MNERKLLERVRNNPRNVLISDLLVLVDAYGFVLFWGTGSHRIFEHPTAPMGLNVQPGRVGMAKPYRVRDF